MLIRNLGAPEIPEDAGPAAEAGIDDIGKSRARQLTVLARNYDRLDFAL